jgi:hypothetical protein
MADNGALLHVSGPEILRGGDGDGRLSLSDTEAAPATADTRARVPSASKSRQRRHVPPLIKTTAASIASNKKSTNGVHAGRTRHEQDSTVARENASKKKGASVAYFKQEESGVRMDHRYIDVHSVTHNDEWFKEMKKLRTGYVGSHEYYVEPDFRWVHLPSNNPEWIKARTPRAEALNAR